MKARPTRSIRGIPAPTRLPTTTMSAPESRARRRAGAFSTAASRITTSAPTLAQTVHISARRRQHLLPLGVEGISDRGIANPQHPYGNAAHLVHARRTDGLPSAAPDRFEASRAGRNCPSASHQVGLAKRAAEQANPLELRRQELRAQVR